MNPLQRVIIFEGPDGTGKTTIARELAKKIEVPYFKFNGEHDFWRKGKFKTALEFDQPFMQQLLLQTGMDIVWDRAYPSEWVYFQVFNRETNMEVLDALDAAYARMGAWIVVTLRKDYAAGTKQDELVTREKVLELHRVYNEFCEWTRCNTIRIYVDTFGNRVERQLPALMDNIKVGDRSVRKSIVLKGTF